MFGAAWPANHGFLPLDSNCRSSILFLQNARLPVKGLDDACWTHLFIHLCRICYEHSCMIFHTLAMDTLMGFVSCTESSQANFKLWDDVFQAPNWKTCTSWNHQNLQGPTGKSPSFSPRDLVERHNFPETAVAHLFARVSPRLCVAFCLHERVHVWCKGALQRPFSQKCRHCK